MKRLALILVALLLLTLAACGEEEPTMPQKTQPTTTIGQAEATLPATVPTTEVITPQPTQSVPTTTVQPPVETTVPPTQPTEPSLPVEPDHTETDLFYLEEDFAGWLAIYSDASVELYTKSAYMVLDGEDLQEMGLSGEEATIFMCYQYIGTSSMVEGQGGDIYTLNVEGVAMRFGFECSDVEALRNALIQKAIASDRDEEFLAMLRGETVTLSEEIGMEGMTFYFVVDENKVDSLEIAYNGVRSDSYEFHENGMCKFELSYYETGTVYRCCEYSEDGTLVSRYYYRENGFTSECWLYNAYGDWVYYEEYDEDGNVEKIQAAQREYFADGTRKLTTVTTNGILSETMEYYEAGWLKKSTEYHENGVVARVEEYNANGDLTICVEFDEDNVRISYNRYEYTYSDDGITLGWKIYGAMGQVLELRENYPDGTRKLIEEYNEDGAIRQRRNFNPAGEILRDEEHSDDYGPGPEWVWVYTYHANGHRATRTTYFKEIIYSHYQYYDNGNYELREYYDDAGALQSKAYYDVNGNNIRTEWHDASIGEGPYAAENHTYYENGQRMSTCEYYYGWLVKELLYYENGAYQCITYYGDNEAMASRWKYREDGSQTSVEYFYTNGNPEYTVTYHENGGVFQETDYYESGAVKEYFEYDQYGGLISHAKYNEDGSVAD